MSAWPLTDVTHDQRARGRSPEVLSDLLGISVGAAPHWSPVRRIQECRLRGARRALHAGKRLNHGCARPRTPRESRPLITAAKMHRGHSRFSGLGSTIQYEQ